MVKKKVRDVLFSVNDYDSDGDVHEEGIYLHFGDTRIKVADSLKAFQDFITHLDAMCKEIADNYILSGDLEVEVIGNKYQNPELLTDGK